MPHRQSRTSVGRVYALLVFLCASFSSSFMVLAADEKKIEYSSNRIIVKFKKNTDLFTRSLKHQKSGVKVSKVFRHFPDTQLLNLPSGMKMENALKLYRDDPNVKYAEPDYIYTTTLTPDDVRYSELWGLDNSGQTGGTSDADINAPQAWDITTGSSNVIVAVIDTGVDYNHPDLNANMWVNPGEIAGNNIDDDRNGYVDDVYGINAISGNGNPMDDHGHGTHVSGTIAADGNNTTGITGVTWNTKIIACKFLNASGSGSTSDAIECLDYLLDLKTRGKNPVDILLSNNSWGGSGRSQALFDAIEQARDAGMLFIAAAGNSNSNNDSSDHYPSDYELSNIISVAATDHNDAKAGFSSYGRRSVEIGAPGVTILSTVPSGSCDMCDASGYATASGTSMATPHVSGLAALIKADDANLSWSEIRNLIISSGQSISALANNTISGKRIRAADNSGVGALTCSNQIINQRVQPFANIVTAIVNEPLALIVQHADCASANGNVDVSVSSGGTITLKDDGLGVDEMAGDSLYSGYYTPAAAGTVTLTLPGADTITVNVISSPANYNEPVAVAFNYRTIAGTALFMGDDSVKTITSPFQIKYGGLDPGYTTVYVSSNGAISFDLATSIGFTNSALPISSLSSLVAVMWDDLNPNTLGDVYWEVQGAAPNRELIIEWRGIPHFGGTTPVTFQVVFFESSSDVLFNYADVNFADEDWNNGRSATVGLQVDTGNARQYSFNTASLSDSFALRWSIGDIQAKAGRDQTVNPGAAVSLNGSGSVGTIVSYNWTQVDGTSVSLNNANTATPDFVAPASAGTLTFELTVSNNSNQVSTNRVDVRVNAYPTANAGGNRFALENDVVTLNGSGSQDSDGRITKYSWTQTAGPAVTLKNASTSAPSFVMPATTETLMFRLATMDDGGLTTTDSVNVFVDVAPIADAGLDLSVEKGLTSSLDGRASRDAAGPIVSYSWRQIAGTTVSLSDSTSTQPEFTAPSTLETLTFELTVTDNSGQSSTDTVDVIVFEESSGGCSVAGRNAAFDPMLPLLLLVSIYGIYRRRYPSTCSNNIQK